MSTIKFAKNIFYLSDNPNKVKAQIRGDITSLDAAKPLRDDISTDEITPVPIMYNFDDRLKHYLYTGFRAGDELPIKIDDIANTNFEVIVAGKRYGKGSSREHSPVAELSAGVRLVIAQSFGYIYRTNADNIGLLTSTDFSLIGRIEKGEAIAIDDIIKDRDPLTIEIIKAGGLIAYGKEKLSKLANNNNTKEANRPQNYVEKILQRHNVDIETTGTLPAPGSSALLQADWRFIVEVYCGMAVHMLTKAYTEPLQLNDPEKIVSFEDHFAYRHRSQHHIKNNLISKFDTLSQAHVEFAKQYNVKAHGRLTNEEGSEGISHSIIAERYALPGQVVVGTDSHTTHSGALGCIAFGTGTTSIANAMMTGVVPYVVPDVIQIKLEGECHQGITAKDIALTLLSTPQIKDGQAFGKVLEFSGSAIKTMSTDERITLTNMATEMGGMCGIMIPDQETVRFLKERRNIDFKLEPWMHSDRDAQYAATITLNCSTMAPMLAAPGDPGNGITLSELKEKVKIDIAYGGSCTAGKRADFDHYYQVLAWAHQHGLTIAPDVELFLQAGSIDVRRYCEQKGYLALFKKMGIELLNPQCGACCNCGPGSSVATQQITISSINRNFPGRSGPGKVWLASPPTVVASAIAGEITSFAALKASLGHTFKGTSIKGEENVRL